MLVQDHNFANDFDEAVLMAAARLLRQNESVTENLIAAALDEVASRRRIDIFHTAQLLAKYPEKGSEIEFAELHDLPLSPIARRRQRLTMFVRDAIAKSAPENGSLETIVSDIEQTERIYLEKLKFLDDTRPTKGSCPEPNSDVAVSLDLLQLAEWKKTVIGDGEFDHLQRLAGGLSKTTYCAAWSEGPTRDRLIIRQDASTSVVGKSVVDEIQLVNLARSGGVPAPRILHVEDMPNKLGEPYAVMEFIDGRPGGRPYSFECGRTAILDFARVLASLHQIEPADSIAGPAEAGAPAVEMRHRIAGAWKDWCQGACVPSPIIECAFLRVINNCHLVSDQRRLVHRDAGPHNLLIAGDNVVSLLDWELAGFGDPVEDLAYCKGAVEEVVPWPKFMETYIIAGGKPVEPERLTFFEYWASLRNASLNAIAMRNFVSGTGTDELGVFTAATVPFLEKRLARIAEPLPIGSHGRL